MPGVGCRALMKGTLQDGHRIDLGETREVTLGSAHAPERAVQAIASWLAEKSDSPVEATAEGAVDLGSRFTYRTWAATQRGLRRLPLRPTWHVAADGTGSSISMHSDEGKYLVRTYQHLLVHQRTFDVLSDELTALLAMSCLRRPTADGPSAVLCRDGSLGWLRMALLRRRPQRFIITATGGPLAPRALPATADGRRGGCRAVARRRSSARGRLGPPR